MEIASMSSLTRKQLEQAAQMLSDEIPYGWPSVEDAVEEICAQFASENILLSLVDNGDVIGWCGILPSYQGKVFELHPLVVRKDCQRKGYGAALVKAAEEAARERGGITLWLGSDDQAPDGETSLANANLYSDLPDKLKNFNPGSHNAAFYLRMGFQVVGVMPDANGLGKPDIYMAKRIAKA
ncbi:MAG: GNAT family N-acetyltransferase [Clostridiales bacterium]|nr:GNAT family N-acetyltransferase [Clostridiales bacterium]